ncbi:MAG: biotin transporter BioY [Ruminococcus sp.]|nr:biotin transporter BioY [Ruminococcus sp.]
MSKSKFNIKDMTLIAMFTALSAVGAFIKIPTPVIPFTLQIVFTCLAGLILGKNKGGLSVALYVLLGLFGLPIFTKGGGFQYIFETTFGYLIGFAVGAYVTGAIAHAKENPSLKRLICASMVNLVIVYTLGCIYGYFILNYVNHVEYGVKAILGAFVGPFIIPDLILSIFTACFSKKLLPILEKQFQLVY